MIDRLLADDFSNHGGFIVSIAHFTLTQDGHPDDAQPLPGGKNSAEEK